MDILKRNTKWILGVIVLVVLVSGVSVYATTQYLATQVSYKDGKSVADALNDLYDKTRPIEVVSSAHFVNSGTTITVDVDSIIVLVSCDKMEATNTETICESNYGDLLLGIGSWSKVCRATSTNVTLTCPRTLSYYVIK